MRLTDEDYRLLADLEAKDGRASISGNRSRAGADRLEQLGLAASRNLNIGTVEYELNEFGRAALVLKDFGIWDPNLELEPVLHDGGLWYLKVSTEGNPAVMMTPGAASRLAAELRTRGAPQMARRIETELIRLTEEPQKSGGLPAISPSVEATLRTASNVSVEATLAPAPITLAHHELMARLTVLEEILEAFKGEPGIGHNNPPSSIEEIVQFGGSDVDAIENATAVLKLQPASPADVANAKTAVATFRTIGERLWKGLVAAGAYTTKQADTFVSETMKSAGAETGKWLVRLITLSSALYAVKEAAEFWLDLVR